MKGQLGLSEGCEGEKTLPSSNADQEPARVTLPSTTLSLQQSLSSCPDPREIMKEDQEMEEGQRGGKGREGEGKGWKKTSDVSCMRLLPTVNVTVMYFNAY
ncbi:hypothetical protein H920_18169 [Fukomys damarensis]|uniref:Uncharacterized protein n=1 Tax=Fukomys damarensis TaxID=885580 RepID=A0A091CRM1_FUKDA|nr:hypothetical protein H920_18169 [Fukomys damarensis]